MDYNECLKRKLLMRIDTNPDLIRRTLEMAGSEIWRKGRGATKWR
jgi:hypothetical protein